MKLVDRIHQVLLHDFFADTEIICNALVTHVLCRVTGQAIIDEYSCTTLNCGLVCFVNMRCLEEKVTTTCSIQDARQHQTQNQYCIFC